MVFQLYIKNRQWKFTNYKENIMNNKFKFLTVLVALVLALGVFAPFTTVKAAEVTETKSVTIHKILMDKAALEAHDANKSEGYDGNAIANIQDFFADKTAKEIAGVYFKLQKANKENPDVNKDEDWSDIEGKSGLTLENGLKLDTTGLKGTFRIVEDLTKSTYKGEKGEQLAGSKAVPTLITLPLVNNDGIVEEAHVYPKNTQDKPQIDKNFAKDNGLKEFLDNGGNKDQGAKYENYQKEKATVTAKIGTKVPYEVKTKLPKNAKYKTLKWVDTMTNGLTFNRDLTIKGLEFLTAGTDYIITSHDRGFNLELTEDGLNKLEKKLAESEVEVTLTYSATVNSNAVVDQPEKNDIKLDYRNKKTPNEPVPGGNPKDKEIKVVKSWDITGDQTVTDADKDAKVVYTLQVKEGDSWKDVKSVLREYNEADPQNSFNYTFTGLDDTKTYRVVESVAGYDPKYVSFVNGVVQITNKGDKDNPKPLNPTEPKVVNGGKKFVKTNDETKDSAKLERLIGAEFYVKNEAGEYLVAKSKDDAKVKAAKALLDDKVKAYNELSAEDQKGAKGTEAKKAIDEAQEAYNKAFIENAQEYTWGSKEDPNVVVLTSDAQGRFEIKGLAYGKYFLEEKTAPKGFAKLSGDVSFEVKKGSYAGFDSEIQYNLENKDAGYAQQVKNKKVSIPQTGGIGTIIFTVGGLALMAGAAFALKKSKEDELEGLA